jgi:hypothetical protein
MTPTEKLRFVLLHGRIAKVDGEWLWTAAPDKECLIRTMKHKSRWTIIEYIYDIIRDENGIKKSL